MGDEQSPLPPRRPTMADVAKEAGVSKSLVSLVVRDSPRVSDKSRAAVLKAIDELGYRPSAIARSLVRQQSNLLGIIMSNAHDEFFVSVLEGVSSHITENKLGLIPLIMHANRDAAIEEQAAVHFLELRVRGIVLMGSDLENEAIEQIAREVPVAVVGRRLDSENVDVIVDDDELGAELATRHLLDLGHRHIAHTTGGSGNGAEERETGFRRAMAEAGCEPIVVAGGYFQAAGVAAAHKILERKRTMPTAVFAANDLSAIGLMDTFRSAGKRVPEDLSVIGYDDVPAARLGRIDLTTINQPAEQMGRMAIRFTHQRLEGKRQEAQSVLMEPTLIVRSTTQPAGNVS